MTVTYTPCQFENFQDPVVPRVYFKPHEGNSVRFYSCSHSLPQMVPPVDIVPGTPFQIHSCWSDVYDAITSAQKFVYLTGWSFHPLIPLIRDNSDPTKSKHLGELLKDASERGCEVRAHMDNRCTACMCCCQSSRFSDTCGIVFT